MTLLDELAHKLPDDSISLRVLFRMRMVYFLMDQFDGFVKQLDRYATEFPKTFIGNLACRLSIPSLLRTGQAEQALSRANALVNDYEKDNVSQEEKAWLLFDRAMILDYMNKRGLNKSNAAMQNDLNTIITQYAGTGAAGHVNRLFKLEDGDAPEPESAAVAVPEAFAVYANYPNPFNPETHIKFDIPEADQVMIEIFDVQGRRVNTLVNSQYQAGYHSVTWRGDTSAGTQAASGMYFYRVRYRDQVRTQKMLLVK